MIKAFKTEIKPTEEQKDKINRTIGTCRFIYNFYIAHNKELYKSGKPFMTGKAFSVWLNNEYLPVHPDKAWIKSVSSKSVKKSMEDACTTYTRFFKGLSGFPKFKKKGKSDSKMYFVKNSQSDCLCERHRLKIPALGWVWLKEKGYLPVTSSGIMVRSGMVSVRAGRYYVSVLVDVPDLPKEPLTGEPLGIDFGIKEFAVVSDGTVWPNINKTDRARKLERKLKREQRRLSRTAKGSRNRKRQILKLQRLHQQLDNVRTDHINKFVAGIVKTKPSHIAIEDLNISEMMKNRHLSKAIASQKLYESRIKLMSKCREKGIEVRIAGRFYPSSKLCHACGNVKKDLKLSERTYKCPVCGYEADRDFNASLNLRDITEYRTA